MTEREQIKVKTRELLQTRIKMEIDELTPQEKMEFSILENAIIAEIEYLGGDYVSAEEFKNNYFAYRDSELVPNFEGLISTTETSFVVAGPYSYTYNGKTMYYMDVTVTPYMPISYLWRDVSGDLSPSVDNLPYSSYKNTPFASSPAGDNITPSDVFGNSIPNDAIGDYSVEAYFLTTANYIYIGNSPSHYMDDYALALISTAVEVYQIHNFNGYSEQMEEAVRMGGTEYDCIVYYNYSDVDYAFQCYYSGRAPVTVSPLSIYYSFGGESLGGFDIVQPLSSPYMY